MTEKTAYGLAKRVTNPTAWEGFGGISRKHEESHPKLLTEMLWRTCTLTNEHNSTAPSSLTALLAVELLQQPGPISKHPNALP